MTVRAAIFLSVRDKATRLPGKVMRPIHGKPAIVHLIDRLQSARAADRLVMTTSVYPGDDGLAALAAANGIECFRGSEEDKLVRYLDAATALGIDFCVVVDGDDLFADPAVIDQIVRAWRADGGDFLVVAPLPLGATGFGVRVEALRRVVALKAERDTEVWGGYFTDTALFDCRRLPPADPALARPELRMTLDYAEDLAFFTAVFDALYRPGSPFTLLQVIDLLNRRPDIVALNREVQARYEARLRQTAPVRLQPTVA
jgi:spore coat polysaccharide biosynthesis protein SpsF